MDVTFEQRDQIGVAIVSGEVDASTAPTLTETLTDHIENGYHHLVADLSNLAYTSSAGLRAMLSAVKLARANGGDVRLAGVQDRIQRVLDLSGFASIIRSFDTVDDAVTSFSQ